MDVREVLTSSPSRERKRRITESNLVVAGTEIPAETYSAEALNQIDRWAQRTILNRFKNRGIE